MADIAGYRAIKAAHIEPAPSTASGAGTRFRLVPFEQIAAPSGSSYLVKGLVPQEGLTVVWGPPKCGKSFWISDLAFHVALGWDYRGHRVKRGTVVYLCLEGERGFASRIEAFRREKLSGQTEAVRFYLIATRLDLACDAELLGRDIRSQLGNAGDCAMIVIDTLNRSLRGSESSDEDMAAYIRGAGILQDTFRCAVVIVHHCGHDATRMRGHSSILGAVDADISVKRDAADQIVASLEHMKDGPEGVQIVSRLKVIELDEDEDGDPITSCVIEPGEGSQAVPKTPKLTDQHRLALDMLKRAIGEAGEVPPASGNIPANTLAVKSETWRQYCYSGTLSEESPETRKKAFQRSTARLQALSITASWGGWVWLTSKQ